MGPEKAEKFAAARALYETSFEREMGYDDFVKVIDRYERRVKAGHDPKMDQVVYDEHVAAVTKIFTDVELLQDSEEDGGSGEGDDSVGALPGLSRPR